MRNYFSEEGVEQKCRTRFFKEIKKGRMLGGPNWCKRDVEEFLGTCVYTIPCGSVPKGDDPHGRIIHDYSYAANNTHSINSSLIENSVQYISFQDRVAALSQVS